MKLVQSFRNLLFVSSMIGPALPKVDDLTDSHTARVQGKHDSIQTQTAQEEADAVLAVQILTLPFRRRREKEMTSRYKALFP
jgi:hypothetical protein